MPLTEVFVNIAFYVFAAVVAAGAIAVASSRNIVRSAFSLLAVLFGAAALYALMKADFIAAAQILIYVGGILVLIIFAVMLTHRITDVNISNESTPGPAAFCACLCLLFALVVIVLYPGSARWNPGIEGAVVREGEVEVRLHQYQADGRTGLAWGGNTYEEGFVLEAEVVRVPGGTTRVRFEAAVDGDFENKKLKFPDGETASISDSRARVAWRPIERNPDAPLKSPEATWRVRLESPTSELTGWLAPESKGPAFTIYKGVTKPTAFALMGNYLLAFEVVSVLLLAALVGAAFLARKEVRT